MLHGRLSPFERRLAASGSAIIVVALGVAVWFGFARVREHRELVAHSREVIRAGDDVLQRLTDAETGQRGFIITGDTSYLAPYRGAKADAAHALRRLRALTAADSLDQLRIDTLTVVADRRLAVLDGRIAIRRTAGFDSARRALVGGGGLTLMEHARALLAGIEQREDSLLARRAAGERREVALLLVLIVLGFVVAAAVAIMLNRALSGYAAAQERAARTLAAQNAQLREQAMELEIQREHLEEQATELELQSNQLQEQATELEAANESLEAAAAELQERTDAAERLRGEAESANRSKSDFLAVMSHDLRTPLSAITGYVDLLRLGIRGPLNEEQTRDLERIESNAQHLLSLMNEVLSFAKVEAGQLDLHVTPLCVGRIVATLESLVAPMLRAGRLTYTVVQSCGDGSCGAVVMADEEKLRQVILNLLTNAIKFTPPGGRTTVRCACDDAHVSIEVSDTGRGIPDEKLATIFEPFVQVDQHLNREGQPGVGLGLAISRQLARRMGGELTVESRVGQGSTFRLRFPRARPAAVAESSLPRQDAPVRAT